MVVVKFTPKQLEHHESEAYKTTPQFPACELVRAPHSRKILIPQRCHDSPFGTAPIHGNPRTANYSKECCEALELWVENQANAKTQCRTLNKHNIEKPDKCVVLSLVKCTPDIEARDMRPAFELRSIGGRALFPVDLPYSISTAALLNPAYRDMDAIRPTPAKNSNTWYASPSLGSSNHHVKSTNRTTTLGFRCTGTCLTKKTKQKKHLKDCTSKDRCASKVIPWMLQAAFGVFNMMSLLTNKSNWEGVIAAATFLESMNWHGF